MLEHGRKAHRQGTSQLADRCRSARQAGEHRPAGRVGQGRKSMIETRFVKHVLNYRLEKPFVKIVKLLPNYWMAQV